MLANALEGIKVLDLSRVLAGPWCTQNLADLGAEVTKVEHPLRGDDTRSWGAPFPIGDGKAAGMSGYFACCNRGKRSITADFTADEGRAVVYALAAQADIVVENFKPGTLRKYGLDYDSLARDRPGLIYLSITGFGQSGPQSDRPGYDYVFQGTGGLMSYTGHPDGMPGAGPLRTGTAVVDLSTGMYATSAVLAALFQRSRTGRGTCIDMALLDVAVAINASNAANYLFSGSDPERSGNMHPNLAPYEVFRCADGYLILAVANDAQFQRFCELAGLPGLSVDSRFSTNAGRVAHACELREVLGPALAARSRAEWGHRFDSAGVPWGPINSVSDVFDDPQVQHRQLLMHAHHPRIGRVPLVRNPMLSASADAERPVLAPPQLGEHTEEVLREVTGR